MHENFSCQCKRFGPYTYELCEECKEDMSDKPWALAIATEQAKSVARYKSMAEGLKLDFSECDE